MKFNLCTNLQGEPSNHPEEFEESSLIEVATFRLSGRMQDVDNLAESMIDGSAMNDRNPVVKAVLCSDLKNHVEKSSSVADVPSIQEPPLQSQLVDYNDNSLTMEVEVCNISFVVYFMVMHCSGFERTAFFLPYCILMNLIGFPDENESG